MNVATYLRVSTTDQSVEAQRMELRSYIAQRGWTVATECADVISGAKRERPGLDRLMEIVRAKDVDAVLCVKLDLMGRSLSHLARIVEEFEKAGVALICTSQGIDTSKSNACGQLQLAVLVAIAQFERALIRERTKAGLAVARAAGKVLGRPSKHLVSQPQRAMIMSQWRAEGGKDYRELGRRLGGVSGATAWRLERKMGPVESATIGWGGSPVLEVE